MAYPPLPFREKSIPRIKRLLTDYPFAHLFTGVGETAYVTRLPFAADFEGETLLRLRAHMNGANPQVAGLDGSDVLVTFSGPDAYISPNWRVDRMRGPTWDYTSYHVWGRVTVRNDRAFFEELIDDLVRPVEARFGDVSEFGRWSMNDASTDYVTRLLPRLAAFEITVSRTEAISKLHQEFPKEDALSAADHLDQLDDPNAKIIASQIRERARERD